MKLYFIFLIFLFCIFNLQAQKKSKQDQFLIESLDPKTKNVVSILESNYEVLAADIDHKYEKQIVKKINLYKNNVIRDIASGSINHNPEYIKLFEEISSKVLTENNLNIDNLQIILDNTFVVNAACLGQGSFIFNLGLIGDMESKDEIAFIFCHELAHLLLDHVKSNIIKKVEEEQGAIALGNKEDLQAIKSSKYGTNKLLRQLKLERAYENMEYSRNAEFEADSLGLILFTNAGFCKQPAISSLLKLKDSDEKDYIKKEEIRSIFSFSDYQLNDKLFKDETSISSVFSNFKSDSLISYDKDALKTHPDISNRIKKLNKVISEKVVCDKSQITLLPLELTNKTNEEIISSLFQGRDLGLCLFFSLNYLKNDPENPFYKAYISICLSRLSIAASNYSFSRYVKTPNTSYTEEYQQLLKFLHKLDKNDLSKIANLFFDEKVNEAKTPKEAYNYNSLLLVLVNDDVAKFNSKKNYYLTKCSNKIFCDDLKPINN